MNCIICCKNQDKLFKNQTCSYSCHHRKRNKDLKESKTHNFITNNPSKTKMQCEKCLKFVGKPNFKTHKKNCQGKKNCKNCCKKLTDSKKTFCNSSCSATYNNTHKKHGCRRSKFEKYCEEQLSKDFPELTIEYNQTSLINYELDIYIPSLKLAFELNGIFHYEPIYGKTLLEKTQSRDKQKILSC